MLVFQKNCMGWHVSPASSNIALPMIVHKRSCQIGRIYYTQTCMYTYLSETQGRNNMKLGMMNTNNRRCPGGRSELRREPTTARNMTSLLGWLCGTRTCVVSGTPA